MARLDRRRAGLDRARRGQDAAGLAPRRLRHRGGRRADAGERSDADVSYGLQRTAHPARARHLLTVIFVITCQIKINVTNAYAGSIAWSNFFSDSPCAIRPVVWLFFNVAIALLLMELGIYKAIEKTLGLYAIVAVAWVRRLLATS